MPKLKVQMRSKPIKAPLASKASKPVASETSQPVFNVKLNKKEREIVAAQPGNLRKQVRENLILAKQAKREEYFTSPEYLERAEYRRKCREVVAFVASDDGEKLGVTGFGWSKTLYLSPEQWTALSGLMPQILAVCNGEVEITETAEAAADETEGND